MDNLRGSWLDHLALVDGQEAEASGRLVRVQQKRLGLVWWHEELWWEDDVLPASAPVVLLLLTDSSQNEELSERIGRRVMVTGLWVDHELHVNTVSDVASVPSIELSPLKSAALSSRMMDEAKRAIETPLFDAGIMLWRFHRVASNGEEELVVSATNTSLAREVLLPLYGDSLRVYQSPWTADDLARLDAAIEAINPAHRYITGAGMSADGVVYRRLALTHLGYELAAILSKFPREMLKLEVQVHAINRS
ncbi:hypothetical protein FQ377_13770 [Arthrobacter echini]|uniref:Uncharacterized protein n=1 Tax=Arthrobacter echini TaxID=1529066 RepID=A0A5D0XJB3_9MICC|nr:hypothetical protein [Arthrobacter echini]TYC96592.1 hypothetical protein FQ377_13770 [Arthrobacter echini]